jgi:O-antigen/teichoic acid export membrane protein
MGLLHMTEVGPGNERAEPGPSPRGFSLLTRVRSSPLGLSFASSFGIQSTTVISGIVLAHTLGPTGRGQLAAAILWPSVLTAVGSLGLTEAATYYSAQGRYDARTVLGSSLLVAAAQAVALTGIGVLVIPLALGSKPDAVIHDSLLYLVYVPFHLTTIYAMGILNGIHRFRAFQTLRLLYVIASTLTLVPLAALGLLTPRSVIVVYLLASTATAIATGIAVARARIGAPLVDRRCLRSLFSYGLKSHTSGVPSLLNERLDQLLISIFLSSSRLGLYVVAVTLTSITGFITSSLTVVALPAIARVEDERERVLAAARYLRIALGLGALVTVPLLVFTRPIIELLFGRDFAAATAVTRILLLAGIFLALGRVLGSILKALNKPLQAGYAELLALATTFAALAALLPAFGIVGAGIASLIAYAVGAAANLRWASRALNASPMRLLFATDRA